MTFVLFYGYTAITGHHYLIADVVIFFLSVAAGQLVGYKILTTKKTASKTLHRLAIAGIAIMVLAFSLLSFYTPRNIVFRDAETGGYGILESYGDHAADPDHDHEP